MLRIVLIQPGSTDFDEQGRIKGSLDLPLSPSGAKQAARIAQQLAGEPIDVIYSSPSQSAMETAEAIADGRRLRIRRLEKLRNIDHGLWHGKLIDEVKLNQPKIYRQGQENPDAFCPPQGEPIVAARQRAQVAIQKLVRKHKEGTVAVVVPGPLASIVRGVLRADDEMDSVWEAEQDRGDWTVIEVQTNDMPVGSSSLTP